MDKTHNSIFLKFNTFTVKNLNLIKDQQILQQLSEGFSGILAQGIKTTKIHKYEHTLLYLSKHKDTTTTTTTISFLVKKYW